jgi:hypothetical protein
MQLKIERPQLKRLLSNGRFFTVTFIKKDGSTRRMTARTGVKKHLRGGTNKNTNPNHLIVWSVADKGYRTVDINAITKLTFNGETYTTGV